MQHVDVEEALADWAGEALVGVVDPLVPLPPDARVRVRALGLGGRFPDTVDGELARVWVQTWHYELRFTFRTDERIETMRAVPWRLRDAARADRTLGGRVRDGWIPLDQADRDDHGRLEPEETRDGWVMAVPVVLTELVRASEAA